MNGLYSILIWCEFQVGVITLAGIGLSLLAGRRAPHLAGSIVATTVLAACLLTVLAPLPIHRWISLDAAAKSISPNRESAAMPAEGSLEAIGVDSDSMPSAGPMIDLQRIISSLRAAEIRVTDLERSRSTVPQFVCIGLAFVAAFGMAQLAFAIWFIRRLRRRSVSVTDGSLLDQLKSISTGLGCRNVPGIRESYEFSDAAVVAWGRPIVLLPSSWRKWTVEERRAVLAHEMAHIVRSDAGWRIVASILLSLHFYNPLLHWLLRRLTLSQEIAADDIAAQVVGTRSYLHALSSLALQQDESIGRKIAPNVLPVFSGQFLRRIEMLRSRKNRPSHRRSIFQALLCMALLALGVALVVTRGMAQPPENKTKTSQVPVRNVSLTKSVVEDKPTDDPTREMFHRTPIDSSIIGGNHPDGMFAVRVSELLNSPQIRSYLPVINATISQALATELKTNSLPSIQLECVEWLAAHPQMSFTKIPEKDAETTEPKTRLMFGAGGFALKLTQPLDLNVWFEKYSPQTTRHSIEGKSVFQCQALLLGPVPVCVWMQDETTLRMGYYTVKAITPETKLDDLSGDSRSANRKKESSTTESKPVAWLPTWRRIDNGIVSVIFASADLSGLFVDFKDRPSFQTEALHAIEKALLALKTRCQLTACSLDLSPNASEMGVRISLVHESSESALQSATDLHEFLNQLKALVLGSEPQQDANPEDVEDWKAIKNVCDLIDAATISVEDYDDHSAAVVLASTIPFAKVMEIVLADLLAK